MSNPQGRGQQTKQTKPKKPKTKCVLKVHLEQLGHVSGSASDQHRISRGSERDQSCRLSASGPGCALAASSLRLYISSLCAQGWKVPDGPTGTLILIDILTGDGYLCSSARLAPERLCARLFPHPLHVSAALALKLWSEAPQWSPRCVSGGCPIHFGLFCYLVFLTGAGTYLYLLR